LDKKKIRENSSVDIGQEFLGILEVKSFKKLQKFLIKFSSLKEKAVVFNSKYTWNNNPRFKIAKLAIFRPQIWVIIRQNNAIFKK
jgi:hypothetical protein